MQHVIGLMQEAAMVLAPVANQVNPPLVEYRVEMVNEPAARALGGDQVVGRTLTQVLPEDTAALLHKLCDEATGCGNRVEHFAAAPDPLTDLGRAPSVSVRLTWVGEVVLCTWLPGWLTAPGDDDLSPITGDGASTADRLEFAKAVDALADAGVGVFSLDLMSGRLIGSSGMHRIFGDACDLQSGLESAVVDEAAWQALLRRGEPMDVEVKHGPHRMRVICRVARAADGYPAVLRGSCIVIDP